ncbi:MAG TPA: lysophospholipid acyltransferase family protein [Pirellulaceae bacterium]|jgi:1-acyl-sn-glycerol-3-phosphate acyltransferase|nr:lysophospholipid acyltransferase family protein [Pirellulaceae bacterium]
MSDPTTNAAPPEPDDPALLHEETDGGSPDDAPRRRGKRERAKQFTRSFAQRVVYDAMKLLIRVIAGGLFQFRVFGADRTPQGIPVIICCNHQSSIDPTLVAAAIPRRLSFLARKELFARFATRKFVEFFDAIPLDRTGFSREGLTAAIDRLKQGRAVLIFPEGSRTPDGTMQPFRSGFLLLARRSRASLLPVAIAGTYQMWPRQRRLPWPTTTHLVVGEPIPYEVYSGWKEEKALAELQRQMQALFDEATASRRRALGFDDDDLAADAEGASTEEPSAERRT